MTTPVENLRKLHRYCNRQHCMDTTPHCFICGVNDAWPCDTVAALDALEAGLHELLDARPTRGQLFQRLDAATVLIRQAMATVHILHFVRQPDSWHDLAKPDIDACPDCAPYRAWLAGAEGEGR